MRNGAAIDAARAHTWDDYARKHDKTKAETTPAATPVTNPNPNPDPQVHHEPQCSAEPLEMVEYFGGIGCATHHTTGIFTPAAYCDSDPVAASAYHEQFPSVPQYGNFVDAIRAGDIPGSLINAVKDVPVAFAGLRCNHYTVLNPNANPNSANADLIRQTVLSLK